MPDLQQGSVVQWRTRDACSIHPGPVLRAGVADDPRPEDLLQPRMRGRHPWIGDSDPQPHRPAVLAPTDGKRIGATDRDFVDPFEADACSGLERLVAS